MGVSSGDSDIISERATDEWILRTPNDCCVGSRSEERSAVARVGRGVARSPERGDGVIISKCEIAVSALERRSNEPSGMADDEVADR